MLPGGGLELDRGARRGRMLLVLAVLLGAVIGLEAGAAAASGDALRTAALAASRGDFPAAIAIDKSIAEEPGSLRLFSSAAVARADQSVEPLTEGWAVALANAGHVDAALKVLEGATGPSAAHTRAALLLSAARDAAATGHPSVALQRLDQILGTLPASDPVVQAAAQARPGYNLAVARVLIASGRAADAVDLLNAAIAASVSGPTADQARGLLPATLLAAGQQAIAAQADLEAVAILTRVANEFPNDTAATTARRLLAADQPVVGTLARRDGTPISGRVRLSSRFRRVGASYMTSAPFYYGVANAAGDFTVDGVALGGPYVLEVYVANSWTTLIDPVTGGPADPATVTALTPSDLGYIVMP